jgi:hypothetical protein
MSLEVTKQELLKQAIYLSKLYATTRNQEYKDQETRIRRIVVELDALTLTGLGYIVPTLEQVTTAGNTTTNTIDTAGTKSDYFLLDTLATPTLQAGMFGWNDQDGTANLRLKGNNVTLQVGQETVARVVNKTGADLLESQYKVVRVRVASEGGSQGQRLAVVLAQGDNDPDSVTTLGVVTETIANNQEGFITVFGNVNGINTTGSLQGETWADGDVLFLSPTTAGALTKVKPIAPNHTVVIGYVLYAHGVNGKIFVKIDNGYELDELHNVKITSVANNDLIQYDSTLQVWKNKQISSVLSNGMLKVASAISTTFQAVTDYLGNASVLFLNSRRIGIGKDTSVTTQSVAVVEVQDTNTSIVLKPNGTGGIIASVPNGATSGGNSRGVNAVDFQLDRVSNTQVSSGANSTIGGGIANTSSNAATTVSGGQSNTANTSYATISGGISNTASGTASTVVGGQGNGSSGSYSVSGGISNSVSARSTVAFGESNTASSNYSTISGGQSNTASTNTHATVVGGQSNTASGQHSIAGGTNNTASGAHSFARGFYCNASGQGSNSLGILNQSQKYASTAIGARAQSYLFGQFSIANENFTSVGFGDCQNSILNSYKSAILTTGATTVLSLDGTGIAELIIPNGNNRAWNVQIDTIAVVTAITGTATGVTVGNTYEEKATMSFKRVGGTSSLVALGSRQQIYDTSMATAIMNFSAGASQQLQIQFQAPAFAGGGSITCRVVSKVSLVEVAY